MYQTTPLLSLWLAKAHGPVPLFFFFFCPFLLPFTVVNQAREAVPNLHPYHPSYPLMLMQTELVLNLVLRPAQLSSAKQSLHFSVRSLVQGREPVEDNIQPKSKDTQVPSGGW